jgi:hypothetical protein
VFVKFLASFANIQGFMFLASSSVCVYKAIFKAV